MKIIRNIFDQTRPIDRQITSVINYAGATEDQLEREIREYEVTDSLARHYERLLSNLADGFAAGAGHEIGVWVSGFYGSGKSSFTKYLGFAFDPKRQLKGDPFLKWLQNQFPGIQLRQQLSTVASKFPATVIMLDLAAVASVQAAARVSPACSMMKSWLGPATRRMKSSPYLNCFWRKTTSSTPSKPDFRKWPRAARGTA